MRPTARLAALAAALLVTAPTASIAAPGSEAAAGKVLDPYWRAETRALVLVFLRADCPISNRYAPEIRRLQEAFTPRGVAFLLVFPDPEATSQQVRAHLADLEIDGPGLLDPDHTVVALAGATVTPEAAVFLPGSRLAYRGRIDDRYPMLGRARPAPATHDLEEALEAVLAGKAVAQPETTAVGCAIAELR